MLDLAMMIAPAFTNLSIMKASSVGTKSFRANAPAVVASPLVLMLSLTIIGIPWSGRSTLVLLYSSSNALAMAIACGLRVVIALI